MRYTRSSGISNVPVEEMARHRQYPPKLHELPEEILAHILARVPFSVSTIHVLGQVCRRFYTIVRPQSQHLFLKLVADLQFPVVASVRRRQLTARCDTYLLNEMRSIHIDVLYIVNAIKLHMTTTEIASEPVGWETDLFDCLMVWQVVSETCARNNLLTTRNINLYMSVVSPEARLTIRYVCVRVANCLARLLERFSGGPYDDRNGYRNPLVKSRDPYDFAVALEHILPRTHGVRGLTDIMSATTMRYDRLRKDTRRFAIYVYFNEVQMNFQFFSHILNSHRPLDRAITAEDWLYNPIDVGNTHTEDLMHAAITQVHITKMIDATLQHGKLNLVEFVCEGATIDRINHLGDEWELEETESGVIQRLAPYRGNVWNERTRRELQRHRHKPGTDEYSVLLDYRYVLDFDWECALDTELLHSDGRLRRSMPPFRDILRQTCAAIEESNQR